jgi:predicted transcriptional regulator with HTH domain
MQELKESVQDCLIDLIQRYQGDQSVMIELELIEDKISELIDIFSEHSAI